MSASSSSLSSSDTPRTTCHVFLSFRGSDTRYDFCDFLYRDLLDSGLRTFRDDDEIRRGENIDAEIEKAIRESQVGLIVFSHDFASSSYCLDEVVMLMDRRRDFGITVIPVFFKVDPAWVSEQTGSFGASFVKHEKKLLVMEGEELRKERERLDGWRRALRQVADLGGMVYNNGYQTQFIKDVVNEVINKVNLVPLYVPSYLVGIDSRMKEINSWLQNGSTAVEVAVICGIGGVGKTTIAKVAYNQNFRKFEKRRFLVNVRETLEQLNGAVILQKKLFSDILSRVSDFHSADEGIEQIRISMGHKRVLIVLDDVDKLDHFLNVLIQNRNWLGPGSKIILTTRNKGLLESHISVLNFVINPLDNNESLHLFSQHAFGQAYPIESYLRVSIRAVDLSCGLPLALEVLGSYLSGLTTITLWERALTELDSHRDGKIENVLWTSYKSLEYELDKSLFLDIACFFNGKPRDYVEKVVDGCDLYKRSGLERLGKRFLVATDEYNRLVMHPLIRDMGRDIVRKESVDPEERSRLWFYQDAFRVLQRNKGTDIIRSFILDQGHAYISSTSAIPFRTEALSRMSKLRFLHLNNVMFKGDFENFPNRLIWLFWHGFPLHCLPSNMILDDVVVLSLQNSSLQYVWEEPQRLEYLKILDLSHGNMLVSTPDFKWLPSLEILNLEYCQNLIKIHESIGLLKKIVSINLKGCRSIPQLPMEISYLNSLKELILCGCSGLYGPPMMEKRLLVSGMRTRLAFPLLPKFLVDLSLENCNLADNNIPRDLSLLPTLESLNLSFNLFSTLPESIINLTSLRSLWLMGCERLKFLPKLPVSLVELNVMECKSLTIIASFPRSGRKHLWVLNCVELVEIGDMFKLQRITRSEFKMILELELLDMKHVENFMGRTNQVLYEFGIFNVFVGGSEIPSWYILGSTEFQFSIKLPHFQGRKIIGLNLCVLFSTLETVQEKTFSSGFRVRVMNRDKHLEWIYSPSYLVLNTVRMMRWFSHWNLRDKLDGGDSVYIDVSIPNGIKIIMVGIHPVYDSKKDSESSDAFRHRFHGSGSSGGFGDRFLGSLADWTHRSQKDSKPNDFSGHSFLGRLDDPAYESPQGSGTYYLMHFPTPRVNFAVVELDSAVSALLR